MKTRLTKYSLVVALALLLALPAAAYSQLGPQGPRFAPGEEGPGQLGPRDFAAQPGAAGMQGARRGARRGAGRELGRQGGPDGRMGRGGRPEGAFDRRGRFGAAPGGRGGRSALAARALARGEQIGLTEPQREQISAAQRGYQESSINRRAQTQIAALELRDLMRADSPDITAVEAKMRELSEQRIAGQTGALRLDAAVGEILSAEQIEQLGEPQQRRGNRDGRRARDAR